MFITCSEILPNVDDVSLSATVSVVVKDDVTVPAIELAICGRVNRNLIRTFNTPDLYRDNMNMSCSPVALKDSIPQIAEDENPIRLAVAIN